MPLLKELSRTSRDSFESDSDSKESRDVRLNSFKSGILRFFDSIDSIFISIRSILRPSVVVDRFAEGSGTLPSGRCPRAGRSHMGAEQITREVHHDPRTQYRSNRNEYRIEKARNATFERIKPILPGFFRIGIQFERIPGRLA